MYNPLDFEVKIRFKFLIFSLIFLLSVQNALAFSQDYAPSDPGVVFQTYFEMINLAPTWSNASTVNKEVVVAVLDSGVDIDHPDLASNIWVNTGEIPGDGLDNDQNSYIDDIHGWDFVSSDNDPHPDVTGEYDYTAVNHGTVVAGVLAATANGNGIVGINPQAKIMALKILDKKGVGNTLVLSQAIQYAVENGADIINLSLVGTTYDDSLKNAIRDAYNNGVMIIAASGNEGRQGVSLNVTPHYPVCDIDSVNRVFGVAAVDESRKLAIYSNYGSNCIDISAPGSKFYSTVYNDESNEKFVAYYQGGWSGTSVAAPIISGTASLIKMNFPYLRPYDIYEVMSLTAQSLKGANPDKYNDLGAGLIDIGAALNLASTYLQPNTRLVLTPESGLAPEVLILDEQGKAIKSWMAYNSNFKGGVNVAVGDVNNDGSDEVVTGPGAGGGPHIRVFSSQGSLLSEFFAYDAKFTGGVNIAIGDLDGDGQKEIITAPQSRGGPHVRVFDMTGQLLSEFFAYDARFSGGVNIAAGDVNNDQKDEIVTAPASGMVAEIKVFDDKTTQKETFLAYDASFTSGVKVAVGDVNNDGWQEIITTPAKNSEPVVKLFSYRGKDKGQFLAYSRYLTGGTEVLAKDFTGDRQPEILMLPDKGGAALLKIYDAGGLEKKSLYLRNVADYNGYNFEVINN